MMVHMSVTDPSKTTSPKGGRPVFSVGEELRIAQRAMNEKHSALAAELGVHRNTIRNICARVARRLDQSAA